MITDLQTQALLQRLDLPCLPAPNHKGLAQITRRFGDTIAFENLDCVAGLPVSADPAAVFEKIVGAGRGGWCYEINQLLAATLQAAGFEVALRLARVGYLRPAFGPLSHLVLQVHCEGQDWLVDAGFGGPGPVAPLPWAGGEHATFRVEPASNGSRTVLRHLSGEWHLLYRIEALDVMPIDIEVANHFLSTWQHSPFRRMLRCIIHTDAESWSLEDSVLTRRDAGWAPIASRTLADTRDLADVLEATFRIRAPEELVARIWHLLARV